MPDKMYRLPAVEDITGIRRSTIYEMIAREDFPRPVRVGRRAVAWRESDIIAWMDGRESTAA